VKMWLPVTTNRTPAWAYPAKQKRNKRDLEKFLNHMPQFYWPNLRGHTARWRSGPRHSPRPPAFTGVEGFFGGD
jgi:hypothetical protein